MSSLDLKQPGIFAAQLHQLLVSSALDDPAIFQEVNAICLGHSGEAVANDDRHPSFS